MRERSSIAERRVAALTALLLLLFPAGRAAGQEAEGPSVAIVVLPPVGNAGDEVDELLAQAIERTASELGFALVPPERVDEALVDQELPEADEDLAALGRELGAAAVLTTSARRIDDGVALRFRLVQVEGAEARSAKTRVRAEQADAQTAELVGRLLEMVPRPAAVPAPAPGPTPPPAVQPSTAPPPAATPAPAAPAAPPAPAGPGAPGQPVAIEFGTATAPPPPTAEELPPGALEPQPPREVGRAFKVFGLAAAVQGAAWLICFVNYMEPMSEFGEDHRNVAYLYATLVPLGSSVVGWAVARGSEYWEPTYPSIVIGDYLGSGVALGLAILTEDEDAFWLYTWMLGPILLPSAGAAIGYAIGRKPKGASEQASKPLGVAVSENVRWTPPWPMVYPSGDRSRRGGLGLSLGMLHF